MSQNKPAENKMGTMPVNRLLLSMSIPIMISMLVQALYNVVDSIFVAQLSEDALNAVSLAFPIQNLMISVAVGTGVGINALLSKSLGEKRQDRANAAAMNGLFLAAVSYLVFMLIGLTCSRLFFAIQTDKQTIVDYGESYMFIVCVLSVGMFFQITFERILQPPAVPCTLCSPSSGRHHQHRTGPHPDLRSVRSAPHGGCRRRPGYRTGPDHCRPRLGGHQRHPQP